MNSHVMIPWCEELPETYKRFVPHSDLVAAEASESNEIFALTKRNDAMLKLLTRAIDALHETGNWRDNAHEHDTDMGHAPRQFSDEDWDSIDGFALDKHKELCDELEALE